MIDVVTQIQINKAIQEVALYAMSPDNTPLWYVNIKSVEWKTQPPLSVGTQIAFKAEFMGRALAYTYEVTQLVPGSKLVMQTSEGPFPMQTTYTFEKISDDKTKMTLRNAGKPTGFSKLLSPFMAIMMRKANNNDLMLLKQILEG